MRLRRARATREPKGELTSERATRKRVRAEWHRSLSEPYAAIRAGASELGRLRDFAMADNATNRRAAGSAPPKRAASETA